MDVQQVDEEVSFNFKQQSTPILRNRSEESFDERYSTEETFDRDATLDYTYTNFEQPLNKGMTDDESLNDSTVISQINSFRIKRQSLVTEVSKQSDDFKTLNASPIICLPHSETISTPTTSKPKRPVPQEQAPVDRFNGILYYVIPTEGQISIAFPKNDLYLSLKESLRKELRAVVSNKDKEVYITHLSGQRCVLTCNNSDTTIIATGPGSKLWRESAFIRLSVGLYRNFTSKMDKDLSPSQTSTPLRCFQDNQSNIQLPADVSPVPSRSSDSQNNGLLTKIMDQIDALHQLTLNLQKQVQNGYTKNDAVNDISLIPHTSVETQTEKTIAHDNQTSSSQCSVFPGTTLYSQALQSNITDKKRKTNTGQRSQTSQQQQSRNPTPSINQCQEQSAAATDHRKIEVVVNNRRKELDNIPVHVPVRRPVASKGSVSQRKTVLLMGDSILNRVNRKGLASYVHKYSVSGATIKSLTRDIELYDLKNFSSLILYIGGNDLTGNTDATTIEEDYDYLLTLIKSGNPSIQIILSTLAPRGDVDVSFVNSIIERLAIHHGLEVVDSHRAFYDRHGELIMRFYNQTDSIHPSDSGIKRILGTINGSIEIVHDFRDCVFLSTQRNQRRDGNEREQFVSVSALRCLNCAETNHKTHECRHKKPIKCWYCGLHSHKAARCWN